MVCTSTPQNGFLSFYTGVKEVLFVERVVHDLFGISVWPIKVYVDNQAVLNVLERAAPSDMNKHMATKYYALQEWVHEGLLELDYVVSKLNLSDILTKVSGIFVPMRNQLLHPRGVLETNTYSQLVQLGTLVNSCGDLHLEVVFV
eukprot:snap_masked-scaffold_3-processed-gene-13.12-mRNA-1 protein AED:1.00 eAED:1.00 QI:0/0/0/0/1/1/2/0/144